MHNLDFQDLVDRFYEALYRFAWSLARNDADACDLTQQTFALWARKGHQLRDSSKVRSWLFTTLYREFVATWRHQAQFPHQELDGQHEEIAPVESRVVEEMDGHTVLQTLSQLEIVYRAPLTLFYLEQHSYKEIAEILEIPMGTVMSRIARGKQQLRALLSEAQAATNKTILPFSPLNNRTRHG